MTPSELGVEHRTHALPGLTMHTAELGEGPPVLLLHGFPESWWSWRHQLQPLARAGFRVVAPDLRGYGKTDKQGPYDLPTLAADVVHLLDALGVPGPVPVVGHDWGGAVAWHLAAHHPARCSRVAVLNCPHPLTMRQALLTRPRWSQVRKSWYMYFFALPWLPEWLLTRGGAGNVVRVIRASAVDRTRFPPEELAPFREAMLEPGAASATVGWYRQALRDGLQGAPAYPPIAQPALLLWGLGDPALGFDDLVPHTRALVPHLEVVPIEGCGHFVQSERPEEVTPRLLSFLRG